MSTVDTVFEYESEPVEIPKIGGLNTSLNLPLAFKAAEFESVGAFVNFFASINTYGQFHEDRRG
jgi:hypothetical protein